MSDDDCGLDESSMDGYEEDDNNEDSDSFDEEISQEGEARNRRDDSGISKAATNVETQFKNKKRPRNPSDNRNSKASSKKQSKKSKKRTYHDNHNQTTQPTRKTKKQKGSKKTTSNQSSQHKQNNVEGEEAPTKKQKNKARKTRRRAKNKLKRQQSASTSNITPVQIGAPSTTTNAIPLINLLNNLTQTQMQHYHQLNLSIINSINANPDQQTGILREPLPILTIPSVHPHLDGNN